MMRTSGSIYFIYSLFSNLFLAKGTDLYFKSVYTI